MNHDITQVQYPLEEKWERLRVALAEAPAPEPTGFTREVYLDIAERIIRTAVPWQDETGTVIDPFKGEETNSWALSVSSSRPDAVTISSMRV